MANKRIHELNIQTILNNGDVMALDNTGLGEAVQITTDNFQSALSLTESQISDLQAYLLSTDIDTLTELNALFTDGTVLITDAPSDGSQYARQDAAWSIIAAAGGLSMKVDTKDTIIASTPTEDTLGFATDALRFYLWINDDTAWYESPINYAENSGVDMGYEKDSSKAGYGLDYISDKTLHNVRILGNVLSETGAIATDTTVSPMLLTYYANGKLNTILYDFTMASGDLRHTPFDASEEIRVWSGDSVAVGLNGQPLVSEYSRDMGAFPSPRKLCGGTF